MSKKLIKPDSTDFVQGKILKYGASPDISQVDGRTVLGGVSTRTGAGAIPLDATLVAVVTTGTDALTLADGVAGQILILTMTTDGGDGTLTPTNLAGGTTITFNDVGDTVILAFDGTNWNIASNNGATVA